MIRTAIVEDEDSAAQVLTDCLNKYTEETGEVFSVERFNNAVTFLENYKDKYDIIFMDIEMEQMDGMTASRKLREIDKAVTLIFVTNMAQFAINGYEVDALDFIVKPVRYYDFVFRMKKAVSRIKSGGQKYISINTTGGGFAKIIVNEIKYVEIMKHSVIYHTESGNFETYGTLKNVEETLSCSHFARCNSCYLVNLKYVNSVKEYTVDVAGEKLKVSQPKKKEFLRALNNYIGGGYDV